jgi:hypothetical protein
MALTWAHAPVRSWFGQVLPGTYAPNIDGDGVDGKITGVAAIRAHDPGFGEDVFLGQAQQVFFVVLKAWTALEPLTAQSVMSPLIFQELNQHDAGFDTVSVRINASSSDLLVDGTGRVIRGTQQPFDWTEDWIFQRPSNGRTISASGAPTSYGTCGAPINPVNFSGVCPYCKALISSPFGWMLTCIDRV